MNHLTVTPTPSPRRAATSSRRARAVAATALGLSLILLGFLTAPAASAAPVSIVCAVGSQTNTYTPPITNTPQPVTIDFTENYNCTSLLTSVTSGTGAYTASTTASCGLTLDGPYSYTETYTWSTGQSSTVTYTTGETVRAANGTTTVTSTGTVTAGLGLGSTVTHVVVEPALSVTACAGAGISNLTGVATLAILP